MIKLSILLLLLLLWQLLPFALCTWCHLLYVYTAEQSISQVNVATYLRRGERFNFNFICNSFLNATVKELLTLLTWPKGFIRIKVAHFLWLTL